MTKAIFFDTGGVLLKEGLAQSIREYERRFGVPEGLLYASAHDRPYWREFTLGNITEDEYWRQLSQDFGQEVKLEDWHDIVRKSFSPNLPLLDFIKTLQGQFILGVISNHPKEWFDYYWDTYKWGDLFTVKAISGYVHIRKPDPKIFQYALRQAGVNGEEAIYVDDRPERVEGAETLGIRVIMYQDVEHLKANFIH
ncbi:hypothetical protein A3H10_01110 [Candidatus Uhrbacteria bacterium RIFCSPLOWO2_12_FULL_46_10]|uniref:Haloacid dehalogenase n=1 Tax=Candidatus Uhrbacteria bacterium RIFCSPLOWO2_01_FULL_47_25 TaxID=1802402 RepID=A0A1F7UWR4_9BACT|nr:MAG: hypothetical protein UX68_C0023G0013 [Parcubacteria group bacterium GW2011_GWA2_46_9]OGL60206.1 MAG: hypothetical protein A2752_01065 [Candidatus Uhrbacteria bacterium RIFCSPHIGHO2_01_FULL_46_23]OGL69670.1 MAG: hypothetical protein A3D60_03035 [Candidatus Uhrbacteria bacterium RIFCSPHIGHO2_02_FULL_47_29]OGL76520.1 MAG: hypothetical protein A3E96_03220 [Candidatus Uhrbacteria bacterium RIFCSPHIGHO2_12_FULL_46_13]OGL82731.1 MAG: hypothetical protein A2936_04050 [Candidatus Uhrbacteria bac